MDKPKSVVAPPPWRGGLGGGSKPQVSWVLRPPQAVHLRRTPLSRKGGGNLLLFFVIVMGFWGMGLAQSSLEFTELYSKTTIRGVEFSPKLQALNGKTVVMDGWMAPPLKPKLDFFVLTKAPLATCPFCSTAADWPPDIVLVIMPPGKTADPTTKRIQVTGRLEVGVKTDEDTGFVSLVRIYVDKIDEAR